MEEKKKHPGGRPRHYNNCYDLDAKCELYFEECDEGETIDVYDRKKQEVKTVTIPIPYTVAGLALYLGFASRQTIFDYEQNSEYSYIIKKSKLRIENQRNVQLVRGDTPPAAGIFDLKANFGYKETDGLEISGPNGKPLSTINGTMTPSDAAKAYASIIKQ